jgi:aspartate/methionine/tyrosine aminotransferase
VVRVETFALERWMSAHEMHVEYDIAESGIFPMTADELLDLVPAGERGELLDRLLCTRLGYSEARGSAELRALLAATYEATGAENILVTTGAIEANYLAMNVLLEPGDHVVAVYPAYQQLYSVPRAIGCDVSPWTVRAEDGWRFDLDDLACLITARTKLIVVNTPHNPTGAVLSAGDLRRVYELAAACGARVLCDEAYRWIEVPGSAALAPPMRDLGPAALSVGTLSKPFGLPGLRVGWIAGPADVIAACWAARDYVSLSPGKLNDALAVVALAHREAVTRRTRAILERNLATAHAWFARHAGLVSWTPPHGGMLALLRYELDIPSFDLANLLAETYSVMLAPGAAFGYEHTLRLGLGQDPPVFEEGLARTAACLVDLRERGVGSRHVDRPA